VKIKLYEFLTRKVRPIELALVLKWLLRIKRREVDVNGASFFLDPVSDFGIRLLKMGEYEKAMSQAVDDILNPGDEFVDLGANEGYFTILAAKKVGPKGVVISIEPQERLWKVIVKNISNNELTNIRLLPYGIGAKKDLFRLNLFPSTNTGASSFSASFNFKMSFQKLRRFLFGSHLVRVLTLDELFSSSKHTSN
jgi:FkbM family methyltransferase